MANNRLYLTCKIAVKIDHMRELHGTDCPCVSCSECGEESPDDAKHCMMCGALFVGNTIKCTAYTKEELAKAKEEELAKANDRYLENIERFWALAREITKEGRY